MSQQLQLGSALTDEFGGLWRLRIGDPSTRSGEAYRVIAPIEDERITILVVRMAHRREGVSVNLGFVFRN